jgi:hypothetical protein
MGSQQATLRGSNSPTILWHAAAYPPEVAVTMGGSTAAVVWLPAVACVSDVQRGGPQLRKGAWWLRRDGKEILKNILTRCPDGHHVVFAVPLLN